MRQQLGYDNSKLGGPNGAVIMAHDWDEYHKRLPESKIELIEGQLIIGNSPQGSRVILHELLRGWGIVEGLSLVHDDIFWS